ncbi:ATP-dependent helicase [Basilea psittacipulmonis]|uniref:DNA 3'-5' helicase n=1 Tax=Basilea psittacipulmonis DSM 24701 TaxID=1072685 RepID=A0A077DG96_9BURK|nr:UvrD-helicase domain-containing protein [Basilea psittacipulmonis]AIL32497.1 hypothetical protein IX83_03520 [Basilea psittacipulmonis DSM 24701]
MNIPFFDKLNDKQKEAVVNDGQYTLVLAGAGSGKTRVLTTRMSYLTTHGVSVYSIMAVTFTNKAANEMLSRIRTVIPFESRYLWVGTFHSLSNRFLRLHHKEAGLSQTFEILDSSDQLSLIKRLIKEHCPEKLEEEKALPSILQNFINKTKEEGLRAKDATSSSLFRAKDPFFVSMYELYEKRCEQENVVDFAELILRSYEVMRDNEAIRQHYQRRFRHLLVDEFQDTNMLQYKWLRIFAGADTSIFVVGDDDQSIYSFRGARSENMSDFKQSLAKDNVVKLEQNYRSTSHILDTANAIIQKNNKRLGKNLWSSSGDGEKVRVACWENDFNESKEVLERIKEFHREGKPYRDMAILYRNNAQSRTFEHDLYNAGILFHVYGGLRFYDRQEVKDVLAYLRVIADLSSNNSFLRVVNHPPRGIGSRTIENLQEHANEIGCPLHQAIEALPANSRHKLHGFIDLVSRLREVAYEKNLAELVAYVIEETGLRTYYAEKQKEKEDKLENLDELVNAAMQFCMENNMANQPALTKETPVEEEDTINLPPLLEFLSMASLESGENQANQSDDAVQLMTIHASKGLEFDTVFLVGLEEGILPSEYSIKNASEDNHLIEEERRLFYVAITRAQRYLFISLVIYRRLYGKLEMKFPSQFLEEMPEEHIHWITENPFSKTDESETLHQPINWARSAIAEKFRNLGKNETEAVPVTEHKESVLKHGDIEYRQGQKVFHESFGEGVITGVSEQGSMPQVTINFIGKGGVRTAKGPKTVALGYVKLTFL